MSNPQGPAAEQLKSCMGLQSCMLQNPDQHPSLIVRFHFTIRFQLLSSSIFCEILDTYIQRALIICIYHKII